MKDFKQMASALRHQAFSVVASLGLVGESGRTGDGQMCDGSSAAASFLNSLAPGVSSTAGVRWTFVPAQIRASVQRRVESFFTCLQQTAGLFTTLSPHACARQRHGRPFELSVEP